MFADKCEITAFCAGGVVMFGPWSTIKSAGDQSETSTEAQEVWDRCPKCSTGVIVVEDWRGTIAYQKCSKCEGRGQVLVDVIVS